MLALVAATVLRLVDADSVRVQDAGAELNVRLVGVDCPETRRNAKCGHYRDGLTCEDELALGRAAAMRARELLPIGAEVRLEPGPRKRDQYGRALAYVRLSDGRDLGLVLLQEGLCKDVGAKYPHPRDLEYAKAVRK